MERKHLILLLLVSSLILSIQSNGDFCAVTDKDNSFVFSDGIQIQSNTNYWNLRQQKLDYEYTYKERGPTIPNIAIGNNIFYSRNQRLPRIAILSLTIHSETVVYWSE